MFQARCIPSVRLRRGFTLVELLVTVGIIAILVGLLLPTIIGIRQQALALKCATNVKQICAALHLYAANNKGLFPPNHRFDTKVSTTAYWYDLDRIGPYANVNVLTTGSIAGYAPMTGSYFVCPSDESSLRSYAMNVWMSSYIDNSTYTVPAQGRLWRGSGKPLQPSRVILVAERWSTNGSSAAGYYATPTIGTVGNKPGLRFGVGGGVTVPNLHWRPNPISELPYLWHRRRGDGGGGTQSYGRVNIGYVDGHVETKPIADMANRTTGLSTGDTLWSPLDESQNR